MGESFSRASVSIRTKINASYILNLAKKVLKYSAFQETHLRSVQVCPHGDGGIH